MTKRRLAPGLRIGIAAIVALAAHAASADELANDGYLEGGSAGFQAGFVAGEIAAVRLVPASCPAQVQRVRFLFGGAGGNRDVILRVWDDSAGVATPGNELFSARYTVTPSNTVLQEIALANSGIAVCGAFRVGIELVAAGLPSVARDDDGTIDANRNFVLPQGLGWLGSATIGLTGDWVIRADVSLEPPFTSELRNDGFAVGGSAGFQGGFVAGEIGAVRLVPAQGPVTVERERFLFGGAAVSRNVVLHIWDDSAETLAPGANSIRASIR
jgi:hypothetical protein